MVAVQRVAVVTVGRSDYGILRPLLRKLDAASGHRLQLIVAGAHRSAEFGATRDEIIADGFQPAAELPMTDGSNDAVGMARSMGKSVCGFADAFADLHPDIVLLLGDRFEMHAAAATAAVMGIPIIHIAGGTVSRGAIDDFLRNSITKLSSVHFAETEASAARLLRLGEAKWRVHVTGALGLDNLHSLPLMSRDEINAKLGIDLRDDFLLATFHPVTRDSPAEHSAHTRAFFQAIEDSERQVLITYPNADAGYQEIIAALKELERRNPARIFSVPYLGTQTYFSLMAHASAMVGNSSSGIVEAASFKLPVVDVGRRQEGRECGANVIRVRAAADDIRDGIRRALSGEFRAAAEKVENPYGDGHATDKMLKIISSLDLADDGILVKEPA